MFAEQGISGRGVLKAFTKLQQEGAECLGLRLAAQESRDNARLAELEANPLVQYAILDAQANVFCPACKLWNTGYGATVMREAVSLMGGYGITEDCPGFLPHKWMDAQLEATYEGPEAVQRRQLSITMTNSLFIAQFENWIMDLKQLAATHAETTGAAALAAAMELWLWSVRHLQNASDANGSKIYHPNRQGVTFPLADALCWLIAARQQLFDVVELGQTGAGDPAVADELPGALAFLGDLCLVQASRAAGEVSRICGEIVFGYHPRPNGSAADTAGLEPFTALRSALDTALFGSGLAKDRAANALTTVMIPEALDYPI